MCTRLRCCQRSTQPLLTPVFPPLSRYVVLQDQEARGRHTWPPVEPPTSDFDLADAYMTLKSLRQRASTSKCLECPRLPEMRTLARRRRTLRKQIKLLRQRLSNESLSLFPDFQQRLDVLETLGYVNADGAVALKGRVAAQINTADELLLTEMIFESTFGEMEPEEIVALLSALVFQVRCCVPALAASAQGGSRTVAACVCVRVRPRPRTSRRSRNDWRAHARLPQKSPSRLVRCR